MAGGLTFAEIGVIGFLAQIIDGALGMGYGVSSSSLLIGAGVHPVVASASIHTSEIFVSLASGAAHFRFGNVKRALIGPLVSFGVLGAIIGACGLTRLPLKPVRLAVGLILMCMGILILCRFLNNGIRSNFSRQKKYSINKLRALGFFAAFIDAIGGGGWGPICTPALVMSGTEPNKAVGSVNLAEFFVTLASCATFYLLMGTANIRWEMIIALLSGGIAGAPVAAFACGKLPKRLLGLLVGVMVIFLSCRILILK